MVLAFAKEFGPPVLVSTLCAVVFCHSLVWFHVEKVTLVWFVEGTGHCPNECRSGTCSCSQLLWCFVELLSVTKQDGHPVERLSATTRCMRTPTRLSSMKEEVVFMGQATPWSSPLGRQLVCVGWSHRGRSACR